MGYPKTIIESRWGALGTLVLLQAYGLILPYFFSGAVQHVAASALPQIPVTMLYVFCGLTFQMLFIYVQGLLLGDISTYLRAATDARGWIRDTTSLQGVLRLMLTIGGTIFYVALLFGKVTLGFPELNTALLLAYQALHPMASKFIAREEERSRCRTRMRYVSAFEKLSRVGMSLLGGGLFFGFLVLFNFKHEPAAWLLQMLGSSIIAFGLTEFLLEDIKGKTREVPVNEASPIKPRKWTFNNKQKDSQQIPERNR